MLDTMLQLDHAVLGLADDDLQTVVALGVGGGIAIVAIIFGSVGKMIKHTANERSRREIAAYVAEGSMTPDDAKKLLESKVRGNCSI